MRTDSFPTKSRTFGGSEKRGLGLLEGNGLFLGVSDMFCLQLALGATGLKKERLVALPRKASTEATAWRMQENHNLWSAIMNRTTKKHI